MVERLDTKLEFNIRFRIILPGVYEIVGPFTWKPGETNYLLMTVDARGAPAIYP